MEDLQATQVIDLLTSNDAQKIDQGILALDSFKLAFDESSLFTLIGTTRRAAILVSLLIHALKFSSKNTLCRHINIVTDRIVTLLEPIFDSDDDVKKFGHRDYLLDSYLEADENSWRSQKLDKCLSLHRKFLEKSPENVRSAIRDYFLGYEGVCYAEVQLFLHHTESCENYYRLIVIKSMQTKNPSILRYQIHSRPIARP